MLDYGTTELNILINYEFSPIYGEECMYFLYKFTDLEYKKFLETYCVEEEKTSANPETLPGDLEAKTREIIGVFCSFLLFTLLRYVFIEYVFISSFHDYHKKLTLVTGVVEM